MKSGLLLYFGGDHPNNGNVYLKTCICSFITPCKDLGESRYPVRSPIPHRHIPFTLDYGPVRLSCVGYLGEVHWGLHLPGAVWDSHLTHSAPLCFPSQLSPVDGVQYPRGLPSSCEGLLHRLENEAKRVVSFLLPVSPSGRVCDAEMVV